MYLPNKYTVWYNRIISNAQSRTADGYSEKHHIIPKSLGGSNKKINLATLTAKEHFVCHLLLPKMTEGKEKVKMIHAIRMMITTKNKHQQERYKVTSRIYSIVREQFSALRKGVPQSEESCRKNSLSHKGKPATKGMTGQKHSEQTLEKMKLKRAEQVITEETKKKLSIIVTEAHNDPSYVNPMSVPEVLVRHKEACLVRSGKKKPCPYCNQLFSANTYTRWHGDNCKALFWCRAGNLT